MVVFVRSSGMVTCSPMASIASSMSTISSPSAVARMPAIGWRVAGSTTLPTAFTADTAPTCRLPSWKARAPSPDFMQRSGPPSLPTVAPVPAPTHPSASGRLSGVMSASRTAMAPSKLVGRACELPNARSNRQLEHTMGTRPQPTSRPMPCFSSSLAAPEAASRPKADPPLNTTACTSSTVFSGLSRSVSRDAGAAPRTSTPPTAPSGATIAVHPVPPARSVKCPNLNPGISVIEMGESVDMVSPIHLLRLTIHDAA